MKRAVLLLLVLASFSARAADSLLVVNKGDSSLMFIDPATLHVGSAIATGADPHEVVISTGGRYGLVTNYGNAQNPGSTLSVIDTYIQHEIRRLTLPVLRPHGMYAAGDHIYFTAEGSRVIGRFDAKRLQVDWFTGTGAEVSHMIVVTADEKKLYTANIGSDSISVIDLTQAPVKIGLKQIPVGKGPEGIDLSPDGTQLWTAHRGDGKLSIIDVATDKVVKTLTLGTKMANRVKFTRDGKHVLVSDPPSSEVLVLDAATGSILKRIKTLAEPEGLVMATDGRRAFVACSGAKSLQVIDLLHFDIGATIDVGNGPDGLAYVPSPNP